MKPNPLKETEPIMGKAGKPNDGEREFETLKDESSAALNILTVGNNTDFAKSMQAMMLQTVATSNLAFQNAVSTMDMVAKQAIRHADIAIDCTWDPGPGEESLKPDTAGD